MGLQAREATLAKDVWLQNFGFVAVYTFCHRVACDAESLSLPSEKPWQRAFILEEAYFRATISRDKCECEAVGSKRHCIPWGRR